MKYDFDSLFDLLINHEGGYVNDPADPGGETKFGISKRSYPTIDIANLTLEDARLIYKRDFWDKYSLDKFPATLRHDVFDFAVNSGPSTAIRHLQRVIDVADDGIVGPVTINTLAQKDYMLVEKKYLGSRLKFMTRLKNWPDFGKGWASRIADLLMAD